MESETHPVQDVDERFKVVPDGMPEVTGEDEEHGGHEVPGALLTCQLFGKLKPGCLLSVSSVQFLALVRPCTCRKPNRPAAQSFPSR